MKRHVPSKIKKIPRGDIGDFVSIVANAYPGFGINTPEERKKMRQRTIIFSKDPTIEHYGVYRRGKLVGGMRTYDFVMNLFSVKALIGGVGLVAVDLLHKKEKVCRDLILYFLEMYRRRGSSLVALYPFRPDFYRKMGFGYGTKVSLYRIKPEDLPLGTSREHVRFLAPEDRRALKRCSDRFWLNHHGMFEMKKHELDYFFMSPSAKTVVYEQGGKILGYVSFVFKGVNQDNLLLNNIVIREMVYENRQVFLELLTFLHTQLDQVSSIVLPTPDETLHFATKDPRDGSDNIIPVIAHQTNTQGIGIMYRVVDTKGIFRLLRRHNFGNQRFSMKLIARDDFLPDNDHSLILDFDEGRAQTRLRGNYDVEVTMDIADFSSLLIGTVDYETLYQYGLTDISDQHFIETVTQTFRVEHKPICHTTF